MNGTDNSKMIRIGLVALVLAATVGWSRDDSGAKGAPPYALTFTGSAFSPHDGSTLHAALVDVGHGETVAHGQAVVANGSFTFSWSGVLWPGRSYRIDYHADVNANGRCDGPPTDHVWSVAVPAAAGDERVAVTHSIDFTRLACNAF